VPSLVFAGPDGVVSGFIAVRPLRLRLDGAPVSAAFFLLSRGIVAADREMPLTSEVEEGSGNKYR
jgi:hypothetical protein